MLIKTLPVGVIQTNCYIIGCEETKAGAIIDPGDEAERILNQVKVLGLEIRYVLNTHAHFDHIGANAEVVAATGAPLALHPADLPLLRYRGGAFYFGMDITPSPDPDIELKEGDELAVGTLKLRVISTPGHTPGHVSFYEPVAGVVFDGDVLFNNGIGRTDVPGGSLDVLLHSIREKLLTLPDETKIYPGHGPPTTVEEERSHNPWL